MDIQSFSAALLKLRQSEPGVYQLLLMHTRICDQLKQARLKRAELRLNQGVTQAKRNHDQASHEAWDAWRREVHLVAQRTKTAHSQARKQMQDAVNQIAAIRDEVTLPSQKRRQAAQAAARLRHESEKMLAAELGLPELVGLADSELEAALIESDKLYSQETAAAMQVYNQSLEEVLDRYNQDLASINQAQSAFNAPFDRSRDIALVDAGNALDVAQRHVQADYAQDLAEVEGWMRDCRMRRKAALDVLLESPAELQRLLEEENQRLLKELTDLQ